MSIGGSVFNVFKDFLTNLQRVSVDGNFSKFKPVVSGAPQGSVLGLLLLIFYTADMWNDLENKIISFVDDTNLYVNIASVSDRINVANSLNRDLDITQLWFST